MKAPRHWPLCGEFTGTGEFPAQRASYAENVSIWWRHHDELSKDTSYHASSGELSSICCEYVILEKTIVLYKKFLMCLKVPCVIIR